MANRYAELDVSIYCDQSVAIVTPETPAAKVWVDEYVRGDVEDAPLQWFGRGFVVEPRYLDALVEGMQASGLDVR
jgi:hypothetical protein